MSSNSSDCQHDQTIRDNILLINQIVGICFAISTPIIICWVNICIVRIRGIQYWIQEVPFWRCFPSRHLLQLSWSIVLILYSLIIFILPFDLKDDRSLIIFCFLITCNILCFILTCIWPIFLYYIKDIRLAFILLCNSHIYLICFILFFIIDHINLHYTTNTILCIIDFLLLNMFHIYIILGLYISICNIKNEEISIR
jgi:hypothetical protein